MKYLALMCLWFLHWDIEFARNTGRNPKHIPVLNDMIDEWKRVLWDLEHPLL